MGQWHPRYNKPTEKRLRRKRKREENAWKAKNGPLVIVKQGTHTHRPHLSHEYLKYITSERWAETRNVYFSKRPRICVACGKSGQAHVELHHLTYARMGHEWWSDLVPLCHDCHTRIHASKLKVHAPKGQPNEPILH